MVPGSLPGKPEVGLLGQSYIKPYIRLVLEVRLTLAGWTPETTWA